MHTPSKTAWLTIPPGTSALTWTSMIWREWPATLLLIPTGFRPRSCCLTKLALSANRFGDLSAPTLLEVVHWFLFTVFNEPKWTLLRRYEFHSWLVFGVSL